ncbi:RNase A-like domain-containing protein [Aquimarina sp. AD10]|uniref:RNase A-like domain-containing protein n=1 Tax=Aquimarina sp. AD10 TaxID=1714849 RepID=UPI0011C4969A|nr:RNase A-like domain-containing protein [Aquimarina sp. AD10]
MKFPKINYFLKLFVLGLVIISSFSSCEKNDDSTVVSIEQLDKEENLFPSKNSTFLRQQESLGGHTIERHVGKSTAYLRNRLNTSSISAASTYYELNQAGQVIVNAINTNRVRINNWLSGGGSRLTLSYTHRRNIGVVLRRGQNNPNPSRKFRVILQKRSSAPNGYYVLTSYPN